MTAEVDEELEEAAAPPEDGDDDTGVDLPSDRSRPRWAGGRLDAPTVMLCVVVALVAAVLTGVLVDRALEGSEPSAGTSTASLSKVVEAPTVEFERFDGTPVSLDDYRGQPLVVNFWGSWCTPCIQEMPDLQRVHESIGEDVAFLGVNIRDDTEAALKMIKTTGVTYDLARDPEGGLIRALELTRFPTTLLIQSDGTIVDRVYARIPAERLCDKINQSLLAGALTECG